MSSAGITGVLGLVCIRDLRAIESGKASPQVVDFGRVQVSQPSLQGRNVDPKLVGNFVRVKGPRERFPELANLDQLARC